MNNEKEKNIRGNLKLDEMAIEWMEKLNAGGWMQSHFIFQIYRRNKKRTNKREKKENGDIQEGQKIG